MYIRITTSTAMNPLMGWELILDMSVKGAGMDWHGMGWDGMGWNGWDGMGNGEWLRKDGWKDVLLFGFCFGFLVFGF